MRNVFMHHVVRSAVWARLVWGKLLDLQVSLLQLRSSEVCWRVTAFKASAERSPHGYSLSPLPWQPCVPATQRLRKHLRFKLEMPFLLHCIGQTSFEPGPESTFAAWQEKQEGHRTKATCQHHWEGYSGICVNLSKSTSFQIIDMLLIPTSKIASCLLSQV